MVDQTVALEWQAWDDALCSGCAQPRHESFDPSMEDHYDVEVLVCHGCAAKERKAHIRRESTPSDAPPLFGEYYIPMPDRILEEG